MLFFPYTSLCLTMKSLTFPNGKPTLVMDTTSSMDCPDCVDDEGEVQSACCEGMESEDRRFDTYTKWPTTIQQRPRDLAQAGLFYTRVDDRVQCPFCSGILKHWLPTDEPYIEHARHFPNCRFIRGYEVGNIPSIKPVLNHNQTFSRSNSVKVTAVNIMQPHSTTTTVQVQPVPMYNESDPADSNIDLTKEDNRLSTYKDWPKTLSQQPEILARSGFYHIPSNERPDRVKCAYCHGKLFNWLRQDDPYIEHAKCFPKCPYIRICLGEDVVRDLTNQSQMRAARNRQNSTTITQPRPTPEPRQERPVPPLRSDDTVGANMRSAPVQAVLEMGFRDDLVKEAVQRCLEERRGDLPPAEDLASLVMQLEDREEASALLPSSSGTAGELSPLRRLMATQGATSSSNNSAGNAPIPSQEQRWRQYRGSSDQIRQENARLRDGYLCKVCMENEVRVTFLPCGHLVCCGPCSMVVSECPLCRQSISGSVMTYF